MIFFIMILPLLGYFTFSFLLLDKKKGLGPLG